ncbi:ORF17 [Plodia interpunctella granulovirus]|uniref:ORF17 n=1 Tax=Plodia interpunctella granulovirus TaxID=262175 RepID=A0A1L5JGI5_9BBAC|nr:ORF17 [Plodia interpunctella granulovirus]APO13901.1 ORF17 [Plodia interpunctella granulovirus]
MDSDKFHKLPLTAQLDALNQMKRSILIKTSHAEKLARMERDPSETLRDIQKKRERFLKNFTKGL